jgi:hypothetical protein
MCHFDNFANGRVLDESEGAEYGIFVVVSASVGSNGGFAVLGCVFLGANVDVAAGFTYI